MLLTKDINSSTSHHKNHNKISNNHTTLNHFIVIPTPLGPMIAIANDTFLIALYFIDETRQDEWITQLSDTTIHKTNFVLNLIHQELQEYFNGTLKNFTVSIRQITHTNFFANVLQCVTTIPYGTTKSYKQIAKELNNIDASRAVGTANKSNVLLLVIPCHRVICSNGSLGGYSQGLNRKAWLLNHEKTFLKI